jgi:F-type H+-transporting ATPase subunit alpha
MDLFTKGIRPAVSPGLSVSRVGSAAQNKVLKKMAGNLKLELAQYREVEDFTRLGFVLDEATQRLVERGEKLTKLLVQERNKPIDIVDQTIFLYAALKGYLDSIPVAMISVYEQELYCFLRNTIFYEPLSCVLRENLEEELLDFILDNFSKAFIKYLLN